MARCSGWPGCMTCGGVPAATTCTIITCAPNAVMAPIHNHMPVILLPEDEDAWLDPDMTEVDAITSYLRPYPDELLEAVRAA